MRRSTCHDRDQYDQPANLQVEQRELVESRDYFVAKKHNTGGQQVEYLINDKSLPCLENKVWVIESVKCLDYGNR